jgi:nucleoside-diphosphate-sugar epimerase
MSAEPASLGPLDIRPEDFDWAQFGRLAEGRPWEGRSVVITGGTGFIGARLAHKLALYGASVTIPTRDKSRSGARIEANVRLVAWTPAEPGSVDAIVAGADTLFHLAYDIRRSGEANLALYRAIADASAQASVRRFIHASSIAVYDGWPIEDLSEDSQSDGPGTPYKLAKRAMERDLEARAGRGELDSVIIQPVNVYGPFSALWTDALVERIRARGLALPAGFDGLNNGVYVDDLVDAFIAAGDLPHGGARRFIVAGPAPIPWAEIFTAYAGGCGRTVEREDWQPASEAPERDPGLVHALKRGLDGLVTQASALLASRIGTSRVNALRTRIAALRPRQSGPYRPVQENPRFYLSRAVVHADRAATELCQPVVSADEGLARTKSYIRWRFGSPER